MFGKLIEEKIREAMEAGEFDNLSFQHSGIRSLEFT